MTDRPSEEEAQAEIADIDALIDEANKTVQRLRERKAALTALAQATERRIAVAMHAVFCAKQHYSNGSDCTFSSEPWDQWSGGQRTAWRTNGKNRLRDSGETAEDFLAALKTVATDRQLEQIMEQTRKIAALEDEFGRDESEEERE